jgi:cytochrome c-type biogenesis protein
VFEEFIANAEQTVHQNPWLALVVVFVGGILTAAAPCVLAMIPLMMSFVAGDKRQGAGPWRALGLSLSFILGLAITFTALGMIAALAGTLYGNISSVWNWIVAAVCLVMGLHLMGLYELNIPTPFELKPRIRGVVGALILGLLFGVVSAPCAAPILVVLLTYLAGSGSSVAYGGLLLLVYALGHSVLILLAGTSMGMARKLLESRKATKAFAVLRQVSGGVIVVIGGYFAYRGLV